jgi:hypothetical protein
MTTRAAQGQHLDRGLLTVAQAGEYLGTGERFVRRLITEASHRTVTLPAAIAAVLKDHLEKHVAAAPDTLLFSTSSGGYLARSNWNSTFRRTADAIGLPAIRPHELRHTGATLAAATGATTKELMRRLGHSSPAAALLYQHAADDHDAEIARARCHARRSPRIIGRRSGMERLSLVVRIMRAPRLPTASLSGPLKDTTHAQSAPGGPGRGGTLLRPGRPPD